MTVVVAPVKPTLSQVHSVKTGICQNDKRRERQLKEKIQIETQFIRKLMSIEQQINDFKQGFKKGEISKTFFLFLFQCLLWKGTAAWYHWVHVARFPGNGRALRDRQTELKSTPSNSPSAFRAI